MTTPNVTYVTAKAAMENEGLPVDADPVIWGGGDGGSYAQFAASVSWAAGVPNKVYQNNYGFAYPGEMPAAIANAVAEDAYSATLAASPAAVPKGSTVTFTLTETGGAGTSFAWTFGDGTTATTTTPT